MDSPIAAHTTSVRTLAARRPSQIVIVSLLLLMFLAAWYAMSRASHTAAAARTAAYVASVPMSDEGTGLWSFPTPAPEVRVAPKPVPQPDPTDWNALSLGVSHAGVAPVASLATAARPAELNASMSDRERWIVYPLLFLALGVALRDKVTRTYNDVQSISGKSLHIDLANGVLRGRSGRLAIDLERGAIEAELVRCKRLVFETVEGQAVSIAPAIKPPRSPNRASPRPTP